MATQECPECGTEIESADDLEQTEVPEIETDKENGVTVYENTDLYLCGGCKKPMGVGRR